MYEEGTKYIVIEIQKSLDGTIGTVIWTYDNQNEADSKYFTILSAAAISNVPKHSATLIHEDGYMIRYETYEHKQEEQAE